MDTAELLTDLDNFLALREDPVWLKDIQTSGGHTIRQYQVKGVELRANDRASFTTLQYYVYREGEPQEKAYYVGNPISGFWRNQVADYVGAYNGEVIRANRPTAICRVVETATEGEKYVLVTETSPGVFSHEDTTLKEFVY